MPFVRLGGLAPARPIMTALFMLMTMCIYTGVHSSTIGGQELYSCARILDISDAANLDQHDP